MGLFTSDCGNTNYLQVTCFPAMILVLSNMSSPGPSDQQSVGAAAAPSGIGQVLVFTSQGWPSAGPPWQIGPAVFGLTSPCPTATSTSNRSVSSGTKGSNTAPWTCDGRGEQVEGMRLKG